MIEGEGGNRSNSDEFSRLWGYFNQPRKLGWGGGRRRTDKDRINRRRDETIHRVGLDGSDIQPWLKPLQTDKDSMQRQIQDLKKTGWRPPTIQSEETDE